MSGKLDMSMEDLVAKYAEVDKALKPMKKHHEMLKEEIKNRLGKEYGVHQYGDVKVELRKTTKTKVREAGLVGALEEAGLTDAIKIEKSVDSEVLDDYLFRGVFPYEKFNEFVEQEDSGALYLPKS